MYLDHRILTFSWIQSENKIFFGIPRNRSLDKKPSYDKEIFNNNSNSPKNINKRNASQTNVKRKNENFIIPIHNNAIAISNVEVIPNELKEFQSNILRNEQNIRIDSILNDNKNNQINILKIPNNKNNNFNNRVIGINPYTKEFRNKKKNYKTNLINIDNKSYVNDNNIKLKKIKINNIDINLQIWDTAGQERFRSITQSFIKGADGILYVYDITQKKSFDDLRGWISQSEEYTEGFQKVIVGNKIDLEDERVVPKEKLQKFCNERNIQGFEVSAKIGKNLSESFEALAKLIVGDKTKDELIQTYTITSKGRGISINSKKKQKKEKKKCC